MGTNVSGSRIEVKNEGQFVFRLPPVGTVLGVTLSICSTLETDQILGRL